MSAPLSVQFNKMSHNCGGWSVLGVMGEKEDLIMDYIKEEDLPEKGNNGYNLRISERSGNQLRCLELILATFPTVILS